MCMVFDTGLMDQFHRGFNVAPDAGNLYRSLQVGSGEAVLALRCTVWIGARRNKKQY